jgi:hypothetical protein
MYLSAHTCHHVFKLGRSIADLAGSERIQAPQRSSIGQAALVWQSVVFPAAITSGALSILAV